VALLAVSVGLPFFVLATTGPLLQRWFTGTGHAAARDPYFLYAAGNAGSLFGLMGYPLLVEPALRLRAQSQLFTIGYLVFVALAAPCIFGVWRKGATEGAVLESTASPVSPLSWARRAKWVLLAFVPSSVLLGATLFMTTDVAPVPLLWVVPLAIYLLTFIVAFSQRVRIPGRSMGFVLGVLAIGLAAGLRFNFFGVPLWLLVLGHLAVVLAAGLVCHGRLAEDRPPPGHLTEFYLLIALGGVLGGVFNALVAPQLFDSVAEYPLAVILACALAPASSRPDGTRRWITSNALDWALPIVLVALAMGLELAGTTLPVRARFGVVAALCLLMLHRPHRLALGLVALMAPTWFLLNPAATIVHAARTFFGVHRVMLIQPPAELAVDEAGQVRAFEMKPYHLLQHGTTGHGIQYLDPHLASIPTVYYHRSGPIGQVFAAFPEGHRFDRLALIGLGAGTLAAYGQPGQHFTFIEIDPEVVRIACDPRLFTYLRDSKADVDVVVGDGRLEISRIPDASCGMVVVDAFSSDSIPVHLMTREAIALYFRKLRPEGILALHITNDYLDLLPVIESIAVDLGLQGLAQYDGHATAVERIERKSPSNWAVLARDRAALGPLVDDARWERLPRPSTRPPDPRTLWTDDFSSLLAVVRGLRHED
jgi:SAM-dependent methyltransferase